ncbi:GTP pyrophosphokinase [Deinococcus xianganensis]|uniref:GTP pyrophosphokinase n=1 Tax=Deinococcus xianganensis TaxID=1507289 RepID=A0A6I4Y8E5_9DEIO|nr:GTP pyrophosphokinase [Deinococcus xianganensis]MXV18619.1 GTP pyrophosphokinase [Deinococcus xianganensis]
MALTNPDEITKLYKEQEIGFKLLESEIASLIKKILSAENIKGFIVESRTKDCTSLINKCVKKNKYSSLSEVTDIVGIRIITLFEKQVDEIAKIIEREFEIDNDNSIDKRKSIDPDRFGYMSLHYVVKMKPKRSLLVEYSILPNIKIEIQIRSILQHAWAEIEHDIGYKIKEEVPKDIRRTFSHAASLIEVTDKYFNEISEKTEEYRGRTDVNFKNNEYNLPIDAITIQSLAQDPYIYDLEKEIVNLSDHISLREDINYPEVSDFTIAGFKSIQEILDFIKSNKAEILEYFMKYFNLDSETFSTTASPRGFSLFNICYIKAWISNKDLNKILSGGLDEIDESWKVEYAILDNSHILEALALTFPKNATQS